MPKYFNTHLLSFAAGALIGSASSYFYFTRNRSTKKNRDGDLSDDEQCPRQVSRVIQI